MSNKEIRIKWLSDESEIDKSIQRLQSKLTQMNRSSAQMENIKETGGTLSKRAQHAQGQFDKTSVNILQRESRELEQQQRKESLGLMQKQRELNKIKQLEGEITKERKDQIDILEREINLKAKTVMDIESTKQETDGRLKSLQGGGGGDGSGPAPASDSKAMGQFKNILKSIGVASVINGALNFTQHRLERDRKVLGDQGATALMASRELREQISGQGSRGMFFAGERQKAMKMAADEQKGQGTLDYAKIAGGVAGGAAAGTFLPGVGNIAGGLIGGAGAFMGMMGGSDKKYNRMFDQDAYKQMMTKEGMQKYESNRKMLELKDPLKTIAFDTQQRDLDKNIALERNLGLEGRELYGEKKQKTPELDRATQTILDTPLKNKMYNTNTPFDDGTGSRFNIPGYEGTGTSPLQGGIKGMNPLTGLMPEEFDFTKAGKGAYDEMGWMEKAMKPYGTNVGFERKDVEGSVQSLIGAGATTEGAEGLAGEALSFQRNLRLQNAPQVMGQMSANGMEVGETEQATLKLMSEAVKLGVDASTMPQEMQKMTTITASLATRGGGFNKDAAATFGAGVTELTQSGMEGAKGAFDEMLGRAKEAGGYEGQMGMGFLMGEGAEDAFGKEGAGKLKNDSKTMNALNQLSADDLAKDKGLAKHYADKLGISVEELMSGMKKKDEFKQTRTGTQQAATEKLGESIKGMSPEEITEFIEGEGSSLYGDVVTEDIAARGTAESGKGRGGRRASVIGRANRLAGNVSNAEVNPDLEDKLTSDEGLSPTEIQKGARATGDKARLDAVNQHLDGLTAAAKKHTTAAELYNQHFDKFVKYAKDSGEALQQMEGQLRQVVTMLEEEGFDAATTQPSTD